MNQKNTLPIQKLVFFVAQDFNDDTRRVVLECIRNMANQRDWVIAAPEPIDEDNKTPLLGGLLRIFSAIPRGSLPLDVDRKHLEEVKLIVELLKRLSFEHLLAIEFELDGEFVGSIEDGNLDKSLREGLLGEWERSIGQDGK